MVSVPWGTASYREGTVNVVPADAQFGVSLEAIPTELEGGGVVIFTVKATNYLNEAYSVKGYVVDEDGVTIKDITATLPADAYDYTLASFSLQVSSVGNHTYKLFLDNADGKPNGVGEEHWNSVRVIVHPSNETELEQVAFECDDLYFTWELIDYHATLICRAVLYNPSNETLKIETVGEDTPWIDIGTGAILMSPPSFKSHLGTFSIEVNDLQITPQSNIIITFTSEISGVPLSVLEYYWGSTYSIRIPYTVHFENNEVFSAIGSGYGKITQNNLHVVVDTAVNVFLFKGSAAAMKGIKAAIVLKEVSKAGDAIRAVVGFLKEIAGWYLWFNN